MTDITYREIKPHQSLSNYIKTYWYFENCSQNHHYCDIMPDGYFDLIVVIQNNQITNIRLTGIWTKMISTTHSPSTIIAVRFKPLALYSLLHIRIGELLDSTASVQANLWLPENELILEKHAQSVPHTINLIENKLLTLLKKEKQDKRLENLFTQIALTSGTTTVDQLANTIGLSTRQVHRRVKELIGIGAKDYMQVVRFKKSLRNITTDKNDFVGYYDQAHFIKEFKKYTGRTPNNIDLKKDVRFIQYQNFD